MRVAGPFPSKMDIILAHGIALTRKRAHFSNRPPLRASTA